MGGNLLIVGGGRRLELCRRLKEYGYNLTLYEMDEQNPAGKLLNIPTIIGKKWDDIGLYIDIEKHLKQNNIGAILPLDCAAVYHLSAGPMHWNTIGKAMTAAALCYDKGMMKTFFGNNEYLSRYYPWPKENKQFIFKPQFGAGSIGIEKHPLYVTSCEDEKYKYITQKFLVGKELSVDCYFSRFDSQLINYCVRERTRVCGPEVVDSITIADDRIYHIIHKINNIIRFKGPVNFQFMEDENKELFLTEINNRIGGGTVLSIEAGVDLPGYIDKEYFNNKPCLVENYRRIGLRMIRAFEGAYFENSI